MVRTCTSRASYATVSWRGSPFVPCPALCSSVLMSCNRLSKMRVAQRKQRLAFQIPGKKSQPNTQQGNRQRDGKNNVDAAWESQGAAHEFRLGQPIQIDQAHEDHPNSYFGQQLLVALQVLGEQQEKRHKEMADQYHDGHRAPAAVQTGAVKADFFREVSGPDDQKLRKGEVGPQHIKSEEQAAELPEVTLVQNPGQWTVARQHHDNNDHHGHRGDQLASDEQKSVNGGSPVWGNGHHPINGREAHDED